MTGATGLFVASLVLLVCMVTISSGQSCDDVTCCPGKVCMEESTSKGPKNKTKCVHATSCDQLNCPAGLACSRKGHNKVHCQPTCANVNCPDSYTCREKGSKTECAWESSTNCSGVQCPDGTTCHLLKEGKKEHTVCLGESCSTVNCFDGTQCYNGTRLTSSSGKDTIIVETENGNATVSLKTLHTKATKESTKAIEESTKAIKESTKATEEPTKSSKERPAPSEQDIAICLPSCEGNTNVCPDGLVCHNDNHKITCRSPRSCEEVDCGPNQQCRELQCTRHRPKHPSRTQTTPPSENELGSGQSLTDSSKPKHEDIILQCVDTDSATETSSPTTLPATRSTVATTESLE